jgi:Leucine-rich repeat (LRR) protein
MHGGKMFARYPYLYLILAFLFTWGLFQVLDSPLVQAEGGSFNCADVTEIPQVECEALVALYAATNRADWRNNGGWLDTNTPCQWHGVTCTGGQVTRLSLNSNQLSGELPAELGNLANLKELYLSNNQLSGEIPSELGSLANLRQLNLWGNQLSGEIPAELGSLVNLQWLWLSGNQLSGEIPSELGSLANLGQLYLGGNQLSGAIPAELSSLANLQGLNLSDNQLSGEIPAELGGLANLWLLWLGGNQLSGEIPPELGSLANLGLLELQLNQLSGEIPPELGSLANLGWLYLSNNQLSGKIPPELGSLANLESLDLGNNQLSGEIPAELGNLTNLRFLRLHQNPLSGELPGFLTNLTLNRFTFYDTGWCVPAEGAVPEWLATIPNLYSSGLICDVPGGSLDGLVTTIEAEAVAGVQVNLYRSLQFNNWQYLTTTHTSKAGSYQFDDLGQGPGIDYRVHFVDPQHQYASQYYDNAPHISLATAITITPGIPRTDIDAVLELTQQPTAVIDPGSGNTTYNPDGTAVIAMPVLDLSDITITLNASCDDDSEPEPVTLQMSTDQSYPMSQLNGGQYRAVIPAADLSHNAATSVAITCSGDTKETDIGVIVLYDPSGFITDAHSGQPVVGATVTLYHVPGWEPRTGPDDDRPNTCQSHDSKGPDDPWNQLAPTHLGVMVNLDVTPVSPPVAYQATNVEGYYGWDVSEGCWYVTVEAEGYKSLVSPVVAVPPEVTDLDLALTPLDGDFTLYLPVIIQ